MTALKPLPGLMVLEFDTIGPRVPALPPIGLFADKHVALPANQDREIAAQLRELEIA